MNDKLDKLKCEVKKLSKLRLRDGYIHLYLSHDMLKYTQKELYKNFHQKEEENKQLKQELEEKDNLIEFTKEEIRKRNKRIDEIVERDKKLFDNKNKEIEKLRKILNFQNINAGIDIKEMWADLFIKQVDKNKQLAIQELERVKMQLKDKTKMMSNEEHCYQQKVVSWIDVCDQINNQIKELKGEK